MGQNCCVAAREKSLPDRNSHEASIYRNIRQSPTWSFRWDNRTHIEDIMENRTTFSHHNSGNATSSAVKRVVNVETNGLSDGESPPKSFQTNQWRKSLRSGGLGNTKLSASDQSGSSNSSLRGNLSHKPSVLPYASTTKPLVTVKVEDPASSSNVFIPSDLNSSRKAARSPGFQLYRQISDSRIPSPEGSHGGSSDGWSMRTFSELVASSQRERLSFDDESFTITGKILGSSLDLESNHFPPNPQPCGICSKLLDEIPPCSRYYGYPVAAVLVCGHVFHAECLENLTPEEEIHDPPCHVCAHKCRRERKTKKRNLIYRAAFAGTNGGEDSSSGQRKRGGKGPIMGASSSMKSSFNKPFLRRHLSVGPRPARSSSENEATRKKWFWPRYTRD